MMALPTPAPCAAVAPFRATLRLFVALVAAWCPTAFAADPVVLTDAAIPYLHAEDDDQDASCDWAVSTPKYLVAESEGAVVFGPAPEDRRRLQLVTQTLHIVGGGVWTGPKWLVIEGRLTDHGRLVGSFEARRQSYRGSLRGCSTVRDFGEAISDDILEWLKAPTLGAKLGDAK